MEENELKLLLSRRLDIRTSLLLKSEFEIEDKENKLKQKFYSIKPTEDIKYVTIVVDGESLMLLNASEFKIILSKDYDFENDEKNIDLILGEKSIKIFLNNRYMEICDNNDILFVLINKENEDLLKLKSGVDTSVPRVETNLSYKGTGWKLSASLHRDLENKPIEILSQIYDELEPPIHQLNHLTLLLNTKINELIALFGNKNLIYIMNGSIYKIDSYEISSGFIQLSRIDVFHYGNEIKSELDLQSIHIIDFLDNKGILINNENKYLIYNNLLFDSKLELVEKAPNLNSVISLYENIDRMNFGIIQFLNQEQETLLESDLNKIDKVISELNELMESETELAKLDYVKDLFIIFNFGLPRYPKQIIEQAKHVLKELNELRETILDD